MIPLSIEIESLYLISVNRNGEVKVSEVLYSKISHLPKVTFYSHWQVHVLKPVKKKMAQRSTHDHHRRLKEWVTSGLTCTSCCWNQNIFLFPRILAIRLFFVADMSRSSWTCKPVSFERLSNGRQEQSTLRCFPRQHCMRIVIIWCAWIDWGGIETERYRRSFPKRKIRAQ